MTYLLPNLANTLKLSAGIKDASTQTAVRSLETWADQLTQRLARLTVEASQVAGAVLSVTGSGRITASPTTGAVVVTVDVSDITANIAALQTDLSTLDADVVKEVLAGSGLTGGGSSGSVTLNIGAGTGIIVNADSIEVDPSVVFLNSDITVTTNTLAKGGAGDTLVDSSITDDGTNVIVNPPNAFVSDADVYFRNLAVDGNATLTIQNDAQVWRLGTYGTAGDSFYIQNITGGLDVFSIAPSGSATFGYSLGVNGNVSLGNATTDAHTVLGTVNFNSTAGSNGQILGISGGLPVWGAPSSFANIVTGAGTSGRNTRWTGTNTIANGAMTDSGTNVATANDDSYFAWDSGGSDRVGFTKKSGFVPKLTYGNATTFAIAMANTATIAASSTYTDRLTIDTSGNATFTGALAVNGNATLGDAPSTDTHTINGRITHDAGGPPSASQYVLRSGGGGGLSLLNYSVDNNAICFDLDWSGGWFARSTSVAALYKEADVFKIYGSIGNTINGSASLNLLAQFTLANGAFTATGPIFAGGNFATSSNELHFMRTTNATDTGYINLYGYNDSTTQFRNLVIADGKGATVATFTASSKSLGVVGDFSAGGSATITGALSGLSTIGAVGNLSTNANLIVAGTSTFTGAVTASNNVTVTGMLTANGAFIAATTSTLQGAVTINGATQVNAQTDHFDALTVQVGNPTVASNSCAAYVGLSASSWADSGASIMGEAFGTVDTTAAARTVWGVFGTANTTIGSGANSLSNTGVRGTASGATTNIGVAGVISNGAGSGEARGVYAFAGSNTATNNYALYATAANGTNNYSFYGSAGTMYNAGNLQVDGNVTLGNASGDAHAITGTLNANGTAGSNGQVLTVVSGVPQWAAAATGTITGSGTSGKHAKFTGASSIGDSLISESGSIVTNTGFFKATSGINSDAYIAANTTLSCGTDLTVGGTAAVATLTVSANATISGSVQMGDGSADAHTLYGNLTFNAAPTAGLIKYGSLNARLYLGRRVFTTAHTGTAYTPSTGTKAVLIRLVGGGGGGGGTTGGASALAGGAGGGSGAYIEKWIDPAATITSTGTMTIGTAGSGGVAAAGGNGNSTSLNIQGTTYTATGGTGGLGMASGTTGAIAYPGAPAAGSSTADANGGETGTHGIRLSNIACVAGNGGSCQLGWGGNGGQAGNTAGAAARGYGGGGGGSLSSNLNQTGGNGSAGIIIIEEYA